MRAGVAAMIAAALLPGCSREGPSFRATDITGAALGGELALSDHNGVPRTLADFRGKVLVVFFGFTHCPDVCPTTLAELARARQQLGADGDRVQVVMVTVDPERDTPQVLGEYVTALDPSFLGLTGDAEAIARAAREFKVFYQKNPGAAPGIYTMDHSSGTFVFDPQGRIRLLVSYGSAAEAFAHDIAQLLAAG